MPLEPNEPYAPNGEFLTYVYGKANEDGLSCAAHNANTNAEVMSECPYALCCATNFTLPVSVTILDTFWKSAFTSCSRCGANMILWSNISERKCSYAYDLLVSFHINGFILADTLSCMNSAIGEPNPTAST